MRTLVALNHHAQDITECTVDIICSLCARLDERDTQFLCLCGPFLPCNFSFILFVVLVTNEDDDRVYFTPVPLDSIVEDRETLEGAARGDRVDQNKALGFSA